MEKKVNYTDEQLAVIDAWKNGNGNIIVGARAGAGKTTLITACMRAIPERSLYTVFSRVAADEAAERIPEGSYAQTLNTLGSAMLRDYWKAKGVRPQPYNEEKYAAIADKILLPFSSMKGYDYLKDDFVDLIKLTRSYMIPWKNEEEIAYIAAHYGINPKFPITHLVPKAIEMGVQQLEKGMADFDDQLWGPYVLGLKPAETFPYVYIDEVQDLSRIKFWLAKQHLADGGRMMMVGDPCQPAGTMVSVPGGWKVPIETLKVGNYVTSYCPSDSAFIMNGRRINGITERPYKGNLVVVSMDNKTTKYTPNHHCFANFKPLEDKYAVYLMRRGNQFRIGKSRMGIKTNGGRKFSGNGPVVRMKQEKADAVWILSMHDTDTEARIQENVIGAIYGLPQLIFNAPGGKTVMSQAELDCAWEQIGDNYERGVACLERFGRDVQYPLATADEEYVSLLRPRVVRACNLLDGIWLLPFNGKSHTRREEWRPITISYEYYDGMVYSLDVDRDHLYVADEIVTHNCQAIMAFAGADNDSYHNVKQEMNADEYFITESFRFGPNIAKESHAEVPDLKGRGNGKDVVRNSGVIRRNDGDDVAILARTNAELVATAFKLYRAGIKCWLKKDKLSKQMGYHLRQIAGKGTDYSTFLERSFVYEQEIEAEMVNAGASTRRLDIFADVMDCLRIAYNSSKARNASELQAEIKTIFQSKSGVALMTAHSSKGLQWKKVIVLRPDKFKEARDRAKVDWQKDQESHLIYVSRTRAIDELCYAEEITVEGAVERAAGSAIDNVKAMLERMGIDLADLGA